MSEEPPAGADHADIVQLAPVLRRVVAARLHEPHAVDDVVQETLSRLMAVRERLDAGTLVPYAIVTARNLIAGQWRQTEQSRRHEHQLIDVRPTPPPEDAVLQREDADAVAAARCRRSARTDVREPHLEVVAAALDPVEPVGIESQRARRARRRLDRARDDEACTIDDVEG